MGHRRNRENETRPRRIHATDGEWQCVREKAETAGLSISAYLVDAALIARSERTSRCIETDAIRLLTVSHQALSEISDNVAGREAALEHLRLADALDRVADRLEKIAAAVAAGSAGQEGAR